MHQRESYNKLLNFLEKRGKPIQNEEKQLMNILKVVVDGGWHIRESEMQEILSMIELTKDSAGVSLIIGSNEKAIKNIAEEIVVFFKLAMKEFGCSTDLVKFIEDQKK